MLTKTSRRDFLKVGATGVVVVVVAGIGAYLTIQQQPSPPQPATPVPVTTPKPAPAEPVAPAVPSPLPPAPAASPPPIAPQPSLTLAEKAVKEGKVNIYSTFDEESLVAIKKAFEKKYPGISVEPIRGGTEIVSRFLAEFRAGKHLMDVHLTSSTYMLPALEEGIQTQYNSPESAAYPPELKDPNGYWNAVQLSPQVIAYNTQLVKGEDIPKTYWDLTKPRFKDKLAILDPRTRAHTLYITKGKIMKERWMEWLKALAAQNPKIHRGAGEAVLMVRNGEADVGLWLYTGTLTTAILKGDPIEYVREPNTMVADLSMVSVAKFAPNPNAARLLYDFITSKEGASVINDMGKYVITRPDVPSKMGIGVGTGKPVPGSYVAFDRLFTEKQLEAVKAEWDQVFKY